ncbi:MAG: sulfotransferase [Hyphomonadaceae bacterium]|nr:sulfotransferase [Hyphomonadaceae bacterium]
MTEDISHLLERAGRLREAGAYGEAATAYEKVLALRPDLAPSWYNLGWVQRRLGLPQAALNSYQRALDLGIECPEEVRLNRAVILSDDLLDAVSAEQELLAALASNPHYLPAALNYANLDEDRGRKGAAAQRYRSILTAHPQCWEALSRLANCTRFETDCDPVIGQLRDATARADVKGPDRASLLFALARALDECGCYDEAFSTYVRANSAAREGAPRYDRARQEALIQRLIDTPTPPAANLEPAKPQVIFICGMFRSGSTLLERVLAAHPKVSAAGETALLPLALSKFVNASNPTREQVAAAADFYRQSAARAFPTAEFVTDKRPDNFLRIADLKAMFPEAKIVRTVRDPLDNCLSVFFLHLDPSMSYAFDLQDIAHYLGQERRLLRHWKERFGADLHNFDYDQFVRRPREVLEEVLAFCGLPWNDDCLAFYERDALVKTASVWQVRRPLHAESSGRWRRYERHVDELRDYVGQLDLS